MSGTAVAGDRQPTVVIAEDEAIVRLDLKEALAEDGYEVVGETGRGDEAVALVTEHHPDLAILDIKMPGLDGLAAASRITELGTTAVLVLTAFSQRDLIERAREAGALAYLVKPYQRAELMPAIEVALARHAEARALEAEVAALQDRAAALEGKLETRRALDRAKGVLMDEHGMSEAGAFRFVQRAAMDRRASMRTVAQDVVEGRLRPS